MREVDFLHKSISVHSTIYLSSNTQSKPKQKLAENEIQGDFSDKSISDSTVAKPFVHRFLSERKKTANNKNARNAPFAVHTPQVDRNNRTSIFRGKSKVRFKILWRNAFWALDTSLLV